MFADRGEAPRHFYEEDQAQCSQHNGPDELEAEACACLHGGGERSHFQKTADARDDRQRNFQKLFHCFSEFVASLSCPVALRRASMPARILGRSSTASALLTSSTACWRLAMRSSSRSANASPSLVSLRTLSVSLSSSIRTRASVRLAKAVVTVFWYHCSIVMNALAAQDIARSVFSAARAADENPAMPKASSSIADRVKVKRCIGA